MRQRQNLTRHEARTIIATVACPFCGAVKGEDCWTYQDPKRRPTGIERGPVRRWPHRERTARYRRWLRAGKITKSLADLTEEDKRRLRL